MPSCTKQSSKKYLQRKSPAYSANSCCGQTKKGNDGKMYVSKKDKNGICKWSLKRSASKENKKSSGKKASPTKRRKTSGKKVSPKRTSKKSSSTKVKHSATHKLLKQHAQQYLKAQSIKTPLDEDVEHHIAHRINKIIRKIYKQKDAQADINNAILKTLGKTLYQHA